MTSGEFKTVPIDFIWVNREARQRKVLKNIEELAASIARVGLIHPPVIERTGELRTGERRLTAVKSLGWTSIPVQFVDELDEAEAQALELEENIARVDIEWAEECEAVLKYHNLRLAIDGEWTVEKTAAMLGYSQAAVSDRLGVAKALADGNTRVAEAPKYTVARGIVKRANARAAASVTSTISSLSVAAEVTEAPVPQAPLRLEDFHDFVANYSGDRFNALHCDFPYGVGLDRSKQASTSAMGAYVDSPDVYWALLDTLALAMNNVVAESAHLMFWFSMDYYHETKSKLEAMGWKINPFPLVWHKSDNTGILPDPQRGPRRIYETAFFGSRGDRLIVRAKSNVFSHPGKDKSIHTSEKPVPMLKYFMEMFVDEYSSVLDPTCGSGNALKAASRLGARQVLGLEKDPEFYERSVAAYFDIQEPTSVLEDGGLLEI